MSVLEAVCTYLEDMGVGTKGTDLFAAVMPDGPDAVVCVYDSGGSAPEQTMGLDPWSIDQPSLQAIVRAPDYAAARAKAEAVRVALASVLGQDLSGIHFLRIEPSGGLLPVGTDPQDRWLISANFQCMVE